jgi:hypothetical protein
VNQRPDSRFKRAAQAGQIHRFRLTIVEREEQLSPLPPRISKERFFV